MSACRYVREYGHSRNAVHGNGEHRSAAGPRLGGGEIAAWGGGERYSTGAGKLLRPVVFIAARPPAAVMKAEPV
jgi:hypothetical protein